MSHTVTETIYKFDELTDDAKECARAWYREDALDSGWWDSVYDDADTISWVSRSTANACRS